MTKTVLAVDDQKHLHDTYERLISRKGHTFISTDNSQDALRLVEGGTSIDVLITDLEMSQLSGDQLIARVHSVSPATKYLMITGKRNEDVVPILIALRSQGIYVTYFQKGQFDLLEIRDAIDALLF